MGGLRYIFPYAFCLYGLLATGQEANAVPWDADNRLDWSHFRAATPANSPIAAITASGISYSFSALENQGIMEVDCTVEAYFYPESSWYRPELANANILNHEQLHFDISELFARKMRTRIDEAVFTSKVKAEIKQIYREIIKELQELQTRYDEETNYSRDVEKQSEWNRMIEYALKKTER